MKPFITTFFILLCTLMNQTARAAQAKPAATTQVYAEHYVHEFFDLDDKPKRPFDNIIRKVLVSFLIALAIIYGSGFFLFAVVISFSSLIGIPIGLGLVYLYAKLLQRILRKQYRRIDARWNRDA
jgi:hypothetical protein